MSDFFGIRLALTALHAQRRGLDVTGHNVANANTPGYSRQRVELAASTGPVAPAVHSRWQAGGQGVTVRATARLRDLFLERRAHQEIAVHAALSETHALLGRVEVAFGEPGDTGIAAQLGDFFAGWDDVANRPDDAAARAQLLERAGTLVATFAATDSALAALRRESADQAVALATEINSTAGAVAELNAAIQRAERSGLPSADLADRRDLLVERLASLAGITTRQGDDGMVEVRLAGTALVRGHTAEALDATVGADGSVTLTWRSYGHDALAGGRAGALVGAVNDVIPRHRAALVDVQLALHDEVNALHSTGYDSSGAPAGDFFTMTPTGIALDPAVAADSGRIAASATGAARDGSLAQSIAELAGALGSYRAMVAGLGVEAQAVGRRLEIQGAVVSEIDGARESVAGVNLDEEMVSMLSFQRAYEAAARFLTAVDQVLDTLVNGTGLVGR